MGRPPPAMNPVETQTTAKPPLEAVPVPQLEVADRRRPAQARFTFKPDPRQLRSLLGDVDRKLAPGEFNQRRRVRLLVGEIVSRLLHTAAEATIELAIEVKENSVRVDVWQPDREPCDFFQHLDEAIFLDLASMWGRDRRRDCGAWFEVF